MEREPLQVDSINSVYEFKDIDGDRNIGIKIGDFIVFATEGEKMWTLNFSHKDSDLNKGDWMDALTGLGAFSTMNLLKPAFIKIIEEVEKTGKDWIVCTDSRRSKLYSRYISSEKIKIIE